MRRGDGVCRSGLPQGPGTPVKPVGHRRQESADPRLVPELEVHGRGRVGATSSPATAPKRLCRRPRLSGSHPAVRLGRTRQPDSYPRAGWRPQASTAVELRVHHSTAALLRAGLVRGDYH